MQGAYRVYTGCIRGHNLDTWWCSSIIVHHLCPASDGGWPSQTAHVQIWIQGFGRNLASVKILHCYLLLSTAYTTWRVAGRKRRLSAAHRNAWAGGMLYRDSVSVTPLIQVFRGRPLALRPLNLVLYASTESRVICTLSWVLDVRQYIDTESLSWRVENEMGFSCNAH